MSWILVTLELYILSVPSSTGGPLETTGEHRGQFPRTDFGPDTESSLLTPPPGPQKLRLFGERCNVMFCGRFNFFRRVNVSLTVLCVFVYTRRTFWACGEVRRGQGRPNYVWHLHGEVDTWRCSEANLSNPPRGKCKGILLCQQNHIFEANNTFFEKEKGKEIIICFRMKESYFEANNELSCYKSYLRTKTSCLRDK